MPDYAWLVQYNPLAYIIETTRYMLLNVGKSHLGLGYTFGDCCLVLSGGIDFLTGRRRVL
jgi:lipopolysaccharide transport system permease protein